jgi:hypothetical protein
MFVVRWQKVASRKKRDRLFGFAEGSALCVGAKPNVLPKAFNSFIGHFYFSDYLVSQISE